MDLDVDLSWLVCGAYLSEVFFVLTDAFASSEVAKSVPTSELVLVCWGYFEVEGFHSVFMIALVVMVKFVSVVEMCFFVRCG